LTAAVVGLASAAPAAATPASCGDWKACLQASAPAENGARSLATMSAADWAAFRDGYVDFGFSVNDDAEVGEVYAWNGDGGVIVRTGADSGDTIATWNSDGVDYCNPVKVNCDQDWSDYGANVSEWGAPSTVETPGGDDPCAVPGAAAIQWTCLGASVMAMFEAGVNNIFGGSLMVCLALFVVFRLVRYAVLGAHP
jgi:hypothetical protein